MNKTNYNRSTEILIALYKCHCTNFVNRIHDNKYLASTEFLLRPRLNSSGSADVLKDRTSDSYAERRENRLAARRAEQEAAGSGNYKKVNRLHTKSVEANQ